METINVRRRKKKLHEKEHVADYHANELNNTHNGRKCDQKERDTDKAIFRYIVYVDGKDDVKWNTKTEIIVIITEIKKQASTINKFQEKYKIDVIIIMVQVFFVTYTCIYI